MSQFERDIPELLQFLGRPIPWDPIPPWLREGLDHRVLVVLAAVHLEVQQQVLSLQADLAAKQAEILRGGVVK